MSRYSDLGKEPPGMRVAPPTIWHPRWSKRPRSPIAIGLRPLSFGEPTEARSLAADHAWQMHPQDAGSEDELRLEAYNDALVRFVVVRGTCDPNDVEKSLALWEGVGDSLAFLALTADGARWLYDAIEAVTIECSPVQREAEDAELAGLEARLREAALPAGKAARVRRLLGFALDLLGGAEA